MTTETRIQMRRDRHETPSSNWAVGYYRWILKAPCAVCGKPYGDRVSGTEESVRRMLKEGRWIHSRCE